MKIHYINILLFELPLNILIYNQRNHKSTTHHTLKIPITRLLCDCELYSPANYDDDPQMKKVMKNFNRQTSERFHEYDERMKTTRQKCKEQCNKEIQKIILKDKLEKELAEKFVTLQTDIQNDAIPTCVCEKSLADKVEKGCLRCGSVFGGGVAPSVGILGGIGQLGLDAWKAAAIKTATKEAIAEATKTATQEGMNAVISKINELLTKFQGEPVVDLTRIVNPSTFDKGTALFETADKLFGEACIIPGTKTNYSFCTTAIYYDGEYNIKNFGKVGADVYKATYTSQKGTLEAAKVGAVEATYGGYQTAIIASIVAILVIVLIMVIIYLILRYRRKKKMKKKLQYIKLLEE
uniref:Variant surface antigen rifin 3 n=1 Tax=Plasmodium falciparum TaxID=5833 RepID=Q9U737_PLAFA|nr:variant surface antigen rifin 3 [Plasmodium falciparum]